MTLLTSLFKLMGCFLFNNNILHKKSSLMGEDNLLMQVVRLI